MSHSVFHRTSDGASGFFVQDSDAATSAWDEAYRRDAAVRESRDRIAVAANKSGPLYALCVTLATETFDALCAYHIGPTTEALNVYAAAARARDAMADAYAIGRGEPARVFEYLRENEARYASLAADSVIEPEKAHGWLGMASSCARVALRALAAIEDTRPGA